MPKPKPSRKQEVENKLEVEYNESQVIEYADEATATLPCEVNFLSKTQENKFQYLCF
jgi:hypothetical protein